MPGPPIYVFWGRCAPGPIPEVSYLDSHDETVLYEGLTAALTGLEAVLGALAIRPLTDVEVADLLAAERDVASVDPGTARTHRRWFSSVHHLMPPGDPHCGPESPENAVVVCPNHRADLEHGVVTVDPQTLEIEHAHDADVTGRRLTTAGDHEPGAQYLEYDDVVVAEFTD